MTKFTEKALTGFPMAFYYSATQSFDGRMAEVESALERLNAMRTEQHRLFTAFDEAYKNSLKSQLSDTIKKKDDERDHIAYVMERVAKLWGEKLDDDTISARRRRWWPRTRRFRTWSSSSRSRRRCSLRWRRWG